MKKHEIITKCIEAYTEAIQVCDKLELDQANNYLDYKGLDLGVCSYVDNVIDQRIYGNEWVKRHNVNFMGWGKYPNEAYTKAELMQSLQIRLEILKKELSIPE